MPIPSNEQDAKDFLKEHFANTLETEGFEEVSHKQLIRRTYQNGQMLNTAYLEEMIANDLLEKCFLTPQTDTSVTDREPLLEPAYKITAKGLDFMNS